ncbi:MAG: threonylcarbamoyl-AMP synthase [Hyphomonadaceae bacterium]|nr:threonylcarbamoyl-AMP synthase [Clostridia bacterium]
MNTQVINMQGNIDEAGLKLAAKLLRAGGTVAFPTETVYGLGANALDKNAVQKIFAAKGRPSDNPLIVHVSSIKEVDKLVTHIPPVARTLMAHFWPGALTLILPRSGIVPDETTAGLDTVAIRLPNHPIAQALIALAGVPIAAPSANRSGKPSPTEAAHVIDDLMGRVDAIIDGGSAAVGLESTVLDCTQTPPMVLRPGGVTVEQLRAVVGDIAMDEALHGTLQNDQKPRSPGMKYTHYAPKAPVIVVEGNAENVIQYINQQLMIAKKENKKAGVMALKAHENAFCNAEVLTVGDEAQLHTVAHNLFMVLRKFDQLAVEVIYAQSVPNTGIGRAILNRLHKAAGYSIVKV